MRLRDKVLVITGGASGIGLATVERCLEEGASVVIADRAGDDGPARAREFTQRHPGRCRFQAADVTSTEQVDALFSDTMRHFGRVDGVFSNAGIGSMCAAADCPDDDYLRVIDVNLNGVFRVARAALRIMRAQGTGSILNCASAIGSLSRPGLTAYSAAKGGVISMTRTLALEGAAHHVRVNAISPGYIETPLIAHNADDRRRHLVSLHPMARLGTPREIACVAAFLLSDEASLVTGANLNVDGGFTAGKP